MPLSDVAALQRAEMFEGLSNEQLLDVASAGLVRQLTPAQRIFSQGDPGHSCHSLLTGRVKILQTLPDGSQSVLRFIGPGEMYGTVAALMDQPFPADAIAVTDSTEIRWSVSAFRDLMRRHPEIGVRSTASAGLRLFDLQNRVGGMTTERVEQRIAKAILRLARQAGRPVTGGVEIDFPITRQDLAEMTGSTLHTVSRTLAAWDQSGVTASRRRGVIVRDLAELERLAHS